MDRLLKDYLVEIKEGKHVRFEAVCLICGRRWTCRSGGSDAGSPAARETAAREAAKHMRMCSFCGRLVCGGCVEDIGGLVPCVQCGAKLRQRIGDI